MKTHRLRWLAGSIDGLALAKLADHLLADQYRQPLSDGFRISEIRKTHVDGSFIERHEYSEIVHGPDGEHTELPRLEYSRTQFRLMTSAPGLELIDPPRSSKVFLMRLARHMNYSIAIKGFSVDVEQWLMNVEKLVGKVHVHSLEVSAIESGYTASARLVTSSHNDIRKTVTNIIGTKKFGIERMGFSWAASNGSCSCELYQSGGAVVRAGRLDTIVPMLREALRSSIG